MRSWAKGFCPVVGGVRGSVIIARKLLAFTCSPPMDERLCRRELK